MSAEPTEAEREIAFAARDEDGRLVKQAAWNAACAFEESANKRMVTDAAKQQELWAIIERLEAQLATSAQQIVNLETAAATLWTRSEKQSAQLEAAAQEAADWEAIESYSERTSFVRTIRGPLTVWTVTVQRGNDLAYFDEVERVTALKSAAEYCRAEMAK